MNYRGFSIACWISLLGVVVAGCGGGDGPSFACVPTCPPGTHCTEAGCLADVERDIGVELADLATAACSSACMGATPWCNPKGVCVPCLEDKHCPAGNICRTFGSTSACVPGCTDDSRCPGGAIKCCGGACVDTSRDTQNCGACGTVCTGQNSAASCVASQCQVGACTAGWGDCNMNAADGCEANLRADTRNCTACGMACALANAIPDCSNGCHVRACSFGWDDCDGKEDNGCEQAVLADSRNCGVCGNVCPVVAHARNNCINAACQLVSCDNGYSDCDGMAANGCEVGVAGDVNNCGACGNKCGQGLVCSQGLCTCPNCNLPNAKSTCVNLKCVVAQCNNNWGDCDGLPQNGCERDVTSDANNCGQCGKVCAQGLVCTNGSCTCPNCVLPNARTACINNLCTLDQCFQDYGNCDGNNANGCETDLTGNKVNCGACGKVCPQNLPNCVGGMCVLAPQLVGQFKVSDGPAWGNNPPCYTCQEACALLFQGNAQDYSCSTTNNPNAIDHKAWVDGWGDSSHCQGQGQPVDENYKKSVNYNCGAGSCAFSAYVMDHGCASINYCFR